ncbi:MAG: hypothetical protein KY456_09365, partial [Chloroflexi bacterium]|nr:hypothetical protein [Chloroflexota bacterium]
MLNRDPQRESPRPPRPSRWGAVAAPSLANEGLSTFRRAYRWLNLTLVHHGVWPLLVVVVGAPTVSIALTPLPWYWARLGAPLLATLLALAYLAQRPQGLPSDMALRTAESTSERDRRLREQATILIVGVTAAVGLLRLMQGPFVPVLKLEAFGLADVAAYQAINFGVVGLAAPAGIGPALPVALFGLSCGMRDLFLAAASPAAESLS